MFSLYKCTYIGVGTYQFRTYIFFCQISKNLVGCVLGFFHSKMYVINCLTITSRFWLPKLNAKL